MITVTAKRWTDSFGNTYHSCKVHRDDELLGALPFSYGYDDHYKQTALEICNEADIFVGMSYVEFTRMDGIVFNVDDVKRKKDLDKEDTTPKYNKANVRELTIYAEHSGDLYRAIVHATHRNMSKKHKADKYDHGIALRQYRRVADMAAKMYVKEHGTESDKWNVMFSVGDRNEVARRLADSQLAEMDLGNYTE